MNGWDLLLLVSLCFAWLWTALRYRQACIRRDEAEARSRRQGRIILARSTPGVAPLVKGKAA